MHSGLYIRFAVDCEFRLASYVENQLKAFGGLINETRGSCDLFLD